MQQNQSHQLQEVMQQNHSHQLQEVMQQNQNHKLQEVMQQNHSHELKTVTSKSWRGHAPLCWENGGEAVQWTEWIGGNLYLLEDIEMTELWEWNQVHRNSGCV